MEQEEYLSIGKVAKRLGVSTQTIRRWQREGKIQELRTYDPVSGGYWTGD